MNSYEQITNQIIANLANAKNWSDMINPQGPINITGRAYQGINMLLLYAPGYNSRIWGTFHQIIKHGGKVKKGEKSSLVCFWSKFTPSQTKQAKEPVEVERWFLKVYRVFNIQQCEFIEGNEYLESMEDKLNKDPISALPNEVITDFLQRENISLQVANRRIIPYYSPSKDLIKITDKSLYKNTDEYLMTLYHEMIHSTGHPKRLKRFDVGIIKFASQDYSLEELAAEIGANFMCAHTGVSPNFLNSVSYIKEWIPHLKEHPRWIVSAAAKAQKAAEYIMRGGAS